MKPKRRCGIIRPTRQEVKESLKFFAPDVPKIQKKIEQLFEAKGKINDKQKQGTRKRV